MDVHSPKIMTRACLRICLKIMANLSCRRFAQENPPFIDAFLLFQTKHLHLQWIFQAVDIASIPSVRKHSSKDHLNEEPQNQIPPDESKGPWRGHRVIFWPFFLRAGDHGDMIFEWKWAQNTVTTDVFCIWCLWNRGETHIFASCFVMMLEKHWQAPQKNKAQPHKTLAGTKQKKTTIYGGPESWVDAGILLFFAFCWCLPMFCEIVQIVLWFFCTFWCLCKFDELVWCWKGKTVFTVFCAHFHSQITSPWFPKEITGNSRKDVLCQVAVPILK